MPTPTDNSTAVQPGSDGAGAPITAEQARHSEPIRRAFSVITIALFLAAIGLPVVDMVLKLDRTPSSEKRTLAPFPTEVVSKQGLGALPNAVKRYCEDNFGFRNLLIRLHGLVKVNGFGVSSTDKVVLGKREPGVPPRQSRWLYYAEHKTMEHHRALDLFTEQELQQWRWVFEQRRDWLASRGCKYLVIVAPNAQEIYPEHLPDSARRIGKETRTDQLIAYLRQHHVVEIVDTRPALHEARRQRPDERLFHRTDTHWNDLGSFAGYQAAAPILQKWYPRTTQPLTREQFELKPRLQGGGDLSGTMGIPDQFDEEWLNLDPKPPLKLRVPREQWHDGLITVKAEPGASPRKPKLVMFRDSFGATMVPYLAEHFGNAVFSWSDQFHRGRVQGENPDIVITQFIERLLMRKPPTEWSVE